jgi:hypothetical protein
MFRALINGLILPTLGNTIARNLASTKIWSLGRPGRSQSLYLLSYPGSYSSIIIKIMLGLTQELHFIQFRAVNLLGRITMDVLPWLRVNRL